MVSYRRGRHPRQLVRTVRATVLGGRVKCLGTVPHGSIDMLTFPTGKRTKRCHLWSLADAAGLGIASRDVPFFRP